MTHSRREEEALAVLAYLDATGYTIAVWDPGEARFVPTVRAHHLIAQDYAKAAAS